MKHRGVRLSLLIVVISTSLGLALAIRAAGNWLVIADSLQAAPSVVILGGQVPFRAIEAANVYQQGWTREVWLTRGAYTEADVALEELGIDRIGEEVYSRRVLERLGVPTEAIEVLPGRNTNTVDEVRTVMKRLHEVRGDRVIIVTSKSHARRVKVIWRSVVGSHPAVIVRYAPGDPFNAARWWRNTADAMAVAREWFGLLNAWTGFPVKSERW